MVLFNETYDATIDPVNGGQAIADDAGQVVINGNGANAVLGDDTFVGGDNVVLNANGLAACANDAYVTPNPISREIDWDRATKEILAKVEEAAIANPYRVQGAFHSVQDCESMVVRKKYSELLVKYGANVQEGFMFAVKHAAGLCLKNLLLDYDVDIEAVDDSGDTPLISSVKRSSVHLVRELVAAGADVDARDADGNDVLTLVQGINAPSITNVLAKAREINADELLSEKAKKVLKYLTFSCCPDDSQGENYQDDARYDANREKAIDLAKKLEACDEFMQKFIIENSSSIDDALSSDLGTWDVARMHADKILVNLAYHHGDKFGCIEHLGAQGRVKILNVMNSFVDEAGNLVCHSIGEYAARVVAKTPAMKEGEGGELVIEQDLWKNITSYLSSSDIVLSAVAPIDPSPSDIVLSAVAPIDPSPSDIVLSAVAPIDPGSSDIVLSAVAPLDPRQADVTLAGDSHPHVPAGDGLTYGPACLD